MERRRHREGRCFDLRVAGVLLALVFAVACSGGGSGGGDGGGDGGGSSDTPTEAALQSADISWSPASGPVAGYRVAVSRDEDDFHIEQAVSEPHAIIRGQPGETVRIRVAAFDSRGNVGPESPPSQPIVFTREEPQLAPASEAAFASAAVSPTPSAFAAPVTRDDADTSDGTPSEPAEATGEPDASQAPEAGDGEAGEPDASEAQALPAQVLLTPGLEVASTLAQFDAPEGGWEIVAAADLDGNGFSDPIWSGAGFVGTSPLDGSGDAPAFAAIGLPEAGWTLIAARDLDGDGRAELLWQDPATAALEAWSLVGDALEPVALPLVEASGTGVVAGDFDGDGRLDLLLDDATTGATRLRRIDSAGQVTDELVALPAAGGSERVAAGDFDGDGRSDLLWREPGGDLSVLFMAGAHAESRLEVMDSAGLEILHRGDFDADGADEILFRDADTGALGVLGLASRVGPAEWIEPLDAGTGWHLVAVGDFDGDGRDDLAWSDR